MRISTIMPVHTKIEIFKFSRGFDSICVYSRNIIGDVKIKANN